MNLRHSRSRIRKSTNADLYAIHNWLVEQGAKKVPGTFLCNWNLTKDSHEEGTLLVYINGEDEQPVAYLWGDLNTGILEVRQDMRGKGIGRELVKHSIKQAIKRDECFLVIECSPPTSIPFWQHMGFTLFNSVRGENYAFKTLEKKHQIPSNGVPVDVAIRFFPEDRNYNVETSAYSTATPKAVKTADGIIHLAERVLFFSEPHPHPSDIVVEIEVAGQISLCDKAKYPEAHKMGVQRCRHSHGFYMDQIIPTFANAKRMKL